MPLDVYQPNGEWDLIDRGVEIGQRKVDGGMGKNRIHKFLD